MAAKRTRTKAPGKRPKRRKRRTALDDEQEMRSAAEALLARIRSTKQSLNDETGPAERSRLRRLLARAHRRVRAFREALESIALEVPRRARSTLREQVQFFLLLEDEFDSDDSRRLS